MLRSWLIVALLLAARQAVAAPATVGVSDVKRGQRGYGLTVFRGYKIERFEVEVIDVLRKFLPKQDLILMRGKHPVLDHAGVLGGMSGSPIYIGGRLAGALAYGWRFSKDAIFGVTPIRSMLPLLQRPLRGPDKLAAVRSRSRARGVRTLRALAEASAWRRDRWWRIAPPRKRDRDPRVLLQPVAVPLNVAGVSRQALPLVRDAFAAYGFEPVQGGGTGKAEGPTSFHPGSAIGVQMVRGDISMTGTGTVTQVQGKKLIAFGHSMFNAGEIYLPVVSSKINHPVASVARSFKLSSPARELGRLAQDRQPGIMVETGRRIPTVPMTLTLRNGKRRALYRVELAQHRLLTPALVRTVTASAVKEAMADVAKATFSVKTRFALRGYRPVVIKEDSYASGGLRTGIFFTRGLRSLRALMNNEFAPAELERIDVAIDVTYGVTPVEIVGARLDSNVVEAGERLRVRVTFRPFGGKEFTKSYPLVIPRSLAGSILKLEIAGGRHVKPERAPPQNLAQLLRYIEQDYPARSVILSLYTPTHGIHLRGRTIRELPFSILDSLRTGAQTREEKVFRTASRAVHRTSRLVAGKKEIRIRVRNEATE